MASFPILVWFSFYHFTETLHYFGTREQNFGTKTSKNGTGRKNRAFLVFWAKSLAFYENKYGKRLKHNIISEQKHIISEQSDNNSELTVPVIHGGGLLNHPMFELENPPCLLNKGGNLLIPSQLPKSGMKTFRKNK